MAAFTLRDVQMIELCIAKEIKRICTKHHIRFFMVDGTLLGAVRHHGFIPWDDDMDFGMLLEDYNRFLRVAKEELSDAFFLQEYESDAEYALPFAKVKMNGTSMKEAVSEHLNLHKGIWVDIFPFVDISKEHLSSAMFFRKSGLLMKAYMLKNGYNLNAITKNRISRLLNCALKHLPVSKKALKDYFSGLFDVDEAEKSGFYMQISTVFHRRFVYKKSYFEDQVLLPFEGELFPAPRSYEDLLTDEYGDYMQLPPESERQNHSIVALEIAPECLKRITQK